MAQRRPHGHYTNQNADAAASWRAEALEADHLEDTKVNRRRQLEETIGEGFYSAKPNPLQQRRSSKADSIEELKRRSEERIRKEQERRLLEEAEKKRQEEANRPKQIPLRRREGSGNSTEHKPRKMSEEDLQDLLRQIRKERGLDEAYEAELARRAEAERRQRRAEALARREEAERRQQRAEERRRQQRVQEPARERAKEPDRRRVRAEAGKSTAKQRKAKKEKKVFTRAFKKGFLIAWGAFVLILIAAMILLWTFLNRYEKGLPEHYINEIVEDLQNGKLDALHLETADGTDLKDSSLFAAEDTVAKYLQDKNTENKLRYVKVNAESTSDENVYLIRSGEENLLKIYMDRTKNGSKKEQWQEQKTLLASDQLKVTELVAQIPTSCTLMINQQTVDRSFITEAGSRIQILSRLMEEGFLHDMPTVDTYTVKGIFAGTEVSMTDESGNEAACQLIGEVYTAGFHADEAFVAEQTERVKSLFDPYARYFSGDAGREALSRVMLDNSPAFVSASSADVSWMQEHDGIELSEESVTNFKKYSEDCYSCDISFVQDIMRDGESVRTWDTNMTWIMVRDGDYYLADIITKTADD